jgi:hypothetical protein
MPDMRCRLSLMCGVTTSRSAAVSASGASFGTGPMSKLEGVKMISLGVVVYRGAA